MKKLKLIVFTMLVSILFVPSVFAACDANKDGNDVAEVTHKDNSDTQYCTTLTDALGEAKDNDVVKVLKGITVEQYEKRKANQPNTFTLDLNGQAITSNYINGENTYGVLYIADGSIVTIIDSSVGKTGRIEHTNDKGGGALNVQKGTVTIKGGTFTNSNAKTNTNAAIQVGGPSDGNKGELIIEDGARVEGGGVYIVRGSLQMNGGVVETEGMAISTNGSDTKESKITINGGTITSKTNAAIYQPFAGTLNIKNGNITGVIGVVVRRGTIDITGGNITARGTGDKVSVGDAKEDGGLVQLPQGVAVIVDNKTPEYSGDAKVTIEGGTLEASGKKAIDSYGTDEEHKNYELSGGTYISAATGEEKPFEEEYIKDKGTITEVKSGNKYALGETSAKEVVANAKSGETVEVIQGDLTVTNVPEGVTVTNKSGGDVKVDGTTLEQGESKYIPVTHNPSTPSKKDYTVVEGVEYVDNGEDIDIKGKVVTETNDTYSKMVKLAQDRGYAKLFNMYDIYEVNNKSLTKPLTLTFNLGEENNGKYAYILHLKHDNTYEKWEQEVVDGKVSISVSELSPFIVALKDGEENKGETNNPQTSSMNVIALGLVTGASLIGLITLVKKNRKGA